MSRMWRICIRTQSCWGLLPEKLIPHESPWCPVRPAGKVCRNPRVKARDKATCPTDFRTTFPETEVTPADGTWGGGQTVYQGRKSEATDFIFHLIDSALTEGLPCIRHGMEEDVFQCLSPLGVDGNEIFLRSFY